MKKLLSDWRGTDNHMVSNLEDTPYENPDPREFAHKIIYTSWDNGMPRFKIECELGYYYSRVFPDTLTQNSVNLLDIFYDDFKQKFWK